ncbi:NADH dehydrogenase subunit [Bacillus cereus]|uniref:NADH dehydrogenase subunit n=1 Tax=Bacillus cereus TaxID=1396 RepID=UPI000BF7A141|nr:NADH dehydrogenase subunit [Bacillus cereus]PER08744.1 NADH dehydrogenase subunit [Bacillus cereus]
MRNFINKCLFEKLNSLLVLILIKILVVTAYICFALAIEGRFKISQDVMLFGSLALFLTLAVIVIKIFNEIPKLYPLSLLIVSFIVIGVWLGELYLWINVSVDNEYFVTTTVQNYIIVAICILIFVFYALYTKSWITIFVVFAIILRSINPSDIKIDALEIIMIVVLVIFLVIDFYKNKTRNKNKPRNI